MASPTAIFASAQRESAVSAVQILSMVPSMPVVGPHLRRRIT